VKDLCIVNPQIHCAHQLPFWPLLFSFPNCNHFLFQSNRIITNAAATIPLMAGMTNFILNGEGDGDGEGAG